MRRLKQKGYTLSKSKGFAHLLPILLIVIVLIVGAYYLGMKKGNSKNGSPSITPTSTIESQSNNGKDLKIFKNIDSTISFSYPEYLRIDHKPDASNIHTGVSLESIDIYKDEKLQLTFMRNDYPDGCDIISDKKPISLNVGGVDQTFTVVCGYYLGKFKDFYINVYFVDTPFEEAGKEILKSLK